MTKNPKTWKRTWEVREERKVAVKYNTFNTLGVRLGSKIRWEGRQSNCETENLQMSEWGCTCSNCGKPPERIVTSSRLWDRVNAVYCPAAHPCRNPTFWTQVHVSHTHTRRLSGGEMDELWKKLVGNVLLFSRSTCLRALNCLFSISGGGLKTAKGETSRGNGERGGERAWVKVIIWITAGNWITLHRGKLIGQKWVEMKLDRWVHILHISQWALPVGFQLNCE